MADDRRTVRFDFIGRDQVTKTLRGIAEESEKLEGQLAALGAGAAAVAGPALAAGTAFAAFAGVAIPSIGRVISAQEDLAASWSGLSTMQKVSALRTKELTDRFEDLANAYQPQALAAFNQVLSTANNMLPKFTDVVDAGAIATNNLIGQLTAFIEGPQVEEFLKFAADTGPAAMDELGQAVTTTGSLVLQLVQDLAPLGMTILQVANGTLSAVNAVAHFNPLLAQFAVTTMMLRGPMTALVGGIGGLATRMKEAAGEGENLSRKQKTLNLLTAAGPSLYVAAGTAIGFLALKWLAARNSGDKLIDTLTREHKAIGNNLAGHKALVQQLERTAETLENDLIEAQVNLGQAVRNANDPTLEQSRVVADLRKRLEETREALEAKREVMDRVAAGAEYLAGKYAITKEEALDLATVAGVDLTKAVTDAGTLTEKAAAQIDKYRASVEAAKNPTQQVDLAMDQLGNSSLTLEDRINGAKAALDAYFNPSLAVFQANIQLKDSVEQLSKAFEEAKGRADGTTAASRQLQSAFATTLQATTELWQATISKNKDDKAATATIRQQIQVLYALAGSNKSLRAEVDALALSTIQVTGKQNISREAFYKTARAMGFQKDEIRKLWQEYSKLPTQTQRATDGIQHFSLQTRKALHAMSDKDLAVTVYANGKFRRATTAGLNAGGPVPWLDGAEPNKDSVPALLTPGEHVWAVREVKAAGGHKAVERLRQAALRGELKGYRVGGAVSFRAKTPPWSKMSALLRRQEYAHVQLTDGRAAYEVAQSLGEAWKEYVARGGAVVAAARRWIGTPYSWGGGGPNGPSYGIGRGAKTWGFDCSGLTEYAWWQGRRVRIGSTTYTQHPNSYRIGGPRPGALGFNSSISHVVLASDRPGYVIEAPYTGAYVREIRKSMPDWRWPRGASTTAGLYAGGPVKRLGEAVISGRALEAERRMAKLAGIASDPGRRRAQGGPVVAGLPYLVGEQGPEIHVPRTGGTVHRSGSTVVVQNITVDVRVPLAYQRGQVGREIADALREYKASGGTLPS